MTIEEGKNKTPHLIVTRPYSTIGFLDSDGTPLNLKPLTEIEIKKGDILGQISNFSVDKDTTSLSLIKEIMDCYSEIFGDCVKKPDVFLHLIQKENLEPLAPRLQIYVSDMVLGNLNRDGFYRTIFDSENPDLKKTKKYVGEVLRLYWADVVEIKGAYYGYRVDP